MAHYVPERGDAIWLDFDPQTGRGQAGRRPPLVLSPATYNRKSNFALVCRITSHSKGYPFESAVPGGLPIAGVALCGQIRCLGWQERHAKRIVKMPEILLLDVTAKVAALIGMDEA